MFRRSKKARVQSVLVFKAPAYFNESCRLMHLNRLTFCADAQLLVNNGLLKSINQIDAQYNVMMKLLNLRS